MTAVEWFAEELNNWRKKEFGESGIIGIPIEVLERAKKIEEEQGKNNFIGGYLTYAMKKNKLPYGIQYLNKLADIEKKGKKVYNKNFKNQKNK